MRFGGDNFTALVRATRADHMSASRLMFMENDSGIVCVKLENSYECDHVGKWLRSAVTIVKFFNMISLAFNSLLEYLNV